MRRTHTRLKTEWDREDNLVRGNIAKYRAMTGVSVEALGAALGLSRTAMYERMKRPETLTLQEYRILMSLFKELGF